MKVPPKTNPTSYFDSRTLFYSISCQQHATLTHLRRFGCVLGCLGGRRKCEKTREQRKRTTRKIKRGDERTGPALNPLKGSSARVPHSRKGANQTPYLTPAFSSYCCLNPRKNVTPPPNFTSNKKRSTGFAVSHSRASTEFCDRNLPIC